MRWSAVLRRGAVLGAVLPAFAVLAPALAEDRPQLSLPLACEPHKTCFIQNYVDLDPGPGVRDYACGTATFDQHSGVDFRVLSAAVTKSQVPVLASADGTVKGLRDGVADVFFKKAKKQDVSGRECGNGVILDHGSGWETQYCHMRKGSIRVTQGQVVKRGDQLGEVGFSGMADFAQVHLTVRHNGKVIDPFLPDAVDGACVQGSAGSGLWEPSAAAAFPYKNGEMIAADFAGAPPNVDALEVDHRDVAPLTPASDTLLLYGRFINLLKGDRVRLVATGPDGALFDETATALDRNKATFVTFAGKRRGDKPWPDGRYNGRVELMRDGGVIATGVVEVEIH
jgi:hypothetical protein